MGGGAESAALNLNSDISITFTAMTLKFHDFYYRNTLSVWTEKIVKKYWVKKKVTKYS